METWKSVPLSKYARFYEVSSSGRVRSLSRKSHPGRVLRFCFDRKGYRRVCLSHKNSKAYYAVHRLVLLAFKGKCPKGHESRHLNGKLYDNRVMNLKWGTQKQNNEDRRTHGTLPVGSKVATAVLSETQVRFIKRAVKAGAVQRQLALKFGVKPCTINSIVVGRNWRHV